MEEQEVGENLSEKRIVEMVLVEGVERRPVSFILCQMRGESTKGLISSIF